MLVDLVKMKKKDYEYDQSGIWLKRKEKKKCLTCWLSMRVKVLSVSVLLGGLNRRESMRDRGRGEL